MFCLKFFFSQMLPSAELNFQRFYCMSFSCIFFPNTLVNTKYFRLYYVFFVYFFPNTLVTTKCFMNNHLFELSNMYFSCHHRQEVCRLTYFISCTKYKKIMEFVATKVILNSFFKSIIYLKCIVGYYPIVFVPLCTVFIHKDLPNKPYLYGSFLRQWMSAFETV